MKVHPGFLGRQRNLCKCRLAFSGFFFAFVVADFDIQEVVIVPFFVFKFCFPFSIFLIF